MNGAVEVVYTAPCPCGECGLVEWTATRPPMRYVDEVYGGRSYRHPETRYRVDCRATRQAVPVLAS